MERIYDNHLTRGGNIATPDYNKQTQILIPDFDVSFDELEKTFRLHCVDVPFVWVNRTYVFHEKVTNTPHPQYGEPTTFAILKSEDDFYVVVVRRDNMFCYQETQGILGWRRASLQECYREIHRMRSFAIPKYYKISENKIRITPKPRKIKPPKERKPNKATAKFNGKVIQEKETGKLFTVEILTSLSSWCDEHRLHYADAKWALHTGKSFRYRLVQPEKFLVL